VSSSLAREANHLGEQSFLRSWELMPGSFPVVTIFLRSQEYHRASTKAAIVSRRASAVLSPMPLVQQSVSVVH
jgi:hypothetical protein